MESSKNEAKTNLMDLPNEVLVKIFKCVDITSRFRMRLNKRLDQIQLSVSQEMIELGASISAERIQIGMYSNGSDLPHNPPGMNAFVQDYTYFNRLRFGLQRLARNTRVQDLRIQMQPRMTDAMLQGDCVTEHVYVKITTGMQKEFLKEAFGVILEDVFEPVHTRVLHCADDSIEDVAESCTLDLEIACGGEKHVLSSADCDRGLRFHYCAMTLHKPTGDLDWARTGRWRLLLSSSPIFILPCLAMNETSLTVVCQEKKCNDTNLDANIELCTTKFLRANEYGDQHSSTCDANSASDNQTLSCLCVAGLLIVLLLQLLQCVHAKRNASKMEKMRSTLHVSPRTNGNSEEYEEYDSANEVECNQTIICGDQKYVLSKADCNRGLIHQYCTKTLIRSSNDEVSSHTKIRLPNANYNQTNNVDLKFTTKELLPDYSYVWQTEKGTLYYAKFVVNWVLYVIFEGKKVTTKLPAEFGMESVSSLGVFGDSLYFQANETIYIATFNPPNALSVSSMRKKMENESIYYNAVCTRKIKDGVQLFYRMSDDPNVDGIFGMLPEDRREYVFGTNIHRRKIIYIRQIDQEVAVEQFNAEILIIKIPMTPKYKWSFGHDSSPYFYMTNGESLFTINTDTREILPTLKFRGVNSFAYIAGVFGSEISLMVNQDGWKLISAQLLDGYFVEVGITGDNIGAIAHTMKEGRCPTIGWKRTNHWELLLSSEPMLNAPCLVMNDTSMIIICDSKQCNDSRLDMDIKNCADKCKEGNSKKRNDDTAPAVLFNTKTILMTSFLLILLILPLMCVQLLNVHRDATRMEKMQKEIFLNTALPEIPRSSSRENIEDPIIEMIDC
ncbi:hypothetical protein PRIPAC_85992 [Pristionchus pacificus]|uniref:F-box domain-containing protein n=1 Tax=Pristionchus pacificus TaxID=54126 RepID=A0A2A6BT81_PRIPA|nr:hypothetical protein PRIPAC_85992 [Pristionchus pacificus]|eukprot:PDM69182.1 hypothetical protein PRIPAC_47484 [Pristionchus pacificus]